MDAQNFITAENECTCIYLQYTKYQSDNYVYFKYLQSRLIISTLHYVDIDIVDISSVVPNLPGKEANDYAK